MRSTAGHALLMGFDNVPNDTTYSTIPSDCAPTATAKTQRTARQGEQTLSSRAWLGEGGLLLKLLGPAIAAVGLGLSSDAHYLTNHSTTGKQLAEIQAQLTQMQLTLTNLSKQVQQISDQVDVEALNLLVQSADKIISAIDATAANLKAVIGYGIQVVCDTTSATAVATNGCTANPDYTTTVGALCGSADDPASLTCNKYFNALNNLKRQLTINGQTPAVAAEDLAKAALGAAGGGAPGSAGIVQYALSLGGSNNSGFLTTEAAAGQRTQWTYYTMYVVYLQTLYTLINALQEGQTQLSAQYKADNIYANVSQLNPTLNLMFGAFPNLPDTAVIDTNAGSTQTDPPYMWSQEVGALMSPGLYTNTSHHWSLSGRGSGLSITANARVYATPTYTGDDAVAPVVMTPAAADGNTWQILVMNNSQLSAGHVPSMSSTTFNDWTPGYSNVESGNNTPQYNAGGNPQISPANGGLSGPLPDLYTNAQPGSTGAATLMTTQSGINDALLTPDGTGLSSAENGVGNYAMYEYGGGGNWLTFSSCSVQTSAANCTLPTYQTQAINIEGVASGQSSATNTGLFDYLRGTVLYNQAETATRDHLLFYNAAENWLWTTQEWGAPTVFGGLVAALIGSDATGFNGGSGAVPPAFNPAGRPVLFVRNQAANDCFYWNSSKTAQAGPAFGSGCLTARLTTADVLGS